MAPIAISPQEKQSIPVEKYKELALGVKGYQKDIEENGTADLPKARVSERARKTSDKIMTKRWRPVSKLPADLEP